jgi:hypothetical protein
MGGQHHLGRISYAIAVTTKDLQRTLTGCRLHSSIAGTYAGKSVMLAV